MNAGKSSSSAETLKQSVLVAAWLTAHTLVMVSLLRLALVEKDGSRRSLTSLFDQHAFGVHPLAFFVLQFLVLLLGTSLVLRGWRWFVSYMGLVLHNCIAREAFWWSIRRQFCSGWLLVSSALIALGFALVTYGLSWMLLAWLAFSLYFLPALVARPRWMSFVALDRRYVAGAFATLLYILVSVPLSALAPSVWGLFLSLFEGTTLGILAGAVGWTIVVIFWVLEALALSVLLFSPDWRSLRSHVKARWNRSFSTLAIVSQLTAGLRFAVALVPPFAVIVGAMIFVVPTLMELHQNNLMVLPGSVLRLIGFAGWISDYWYLLLPAPIVLLSNLYLARCLYVHERSLGVQPFDTGRVI